MPQVFLQELQIQLNTIDARLREIEDAAYQGAFSPPCRKQDEAEYRKLKKRRRQIQQKIIFYEPKAK